VSSVAGTPDAPAHRRGRRKVREGLVATSAMNKTVVVVIEELKPHPLYKKVVRHRTRLKAHDENNACSVGDRVRIAETRPLSKDKRWRLDEILEKAK
jgi:small subunit ribosomal protein S17